MSVRSTDDTPLDRGENETRVFMLCAIVTLDIFFNNIPLQYGIIVLTSQHIKTGVCHCLYKYSDYVNDKENSVDMKDVFRMNTEMHISS